RRRDLWPLRRQHSRLASRAPVVLRLVSEGVRQARWALALPVAPDGGRCALRRRSEVGERGVTHSGPTPRANSRGWHILRHERQASTVTADSDHMFARPDSATSRDAAYRGL